MKKENNPAYSKGFGELDDLKNNEIPRPKLKDKKDLTPIEAFNEKLGSLFKNKTSGSVSDEKKEKSEKLS